jgi:putative FmdB family regulatory protein
MPIYGYNCKSCEHTFDALQKMNDQKLVDCPECDEPSLRKLLSAPKFRLKGKGWYETDFKTGDKRNIAGDSDKKSDSKSKDSDKTVTKTETKKPTPDSKAKSA